MRRAACVLAFAGMISTAAAGSVVLLDGTAYEGELSLDGTIVVRGEASAKVQIRTVLTARFAGRLPQDFQPGVVLTDGTRIAGAFTALTDEVVTVRGLRIPSAEVAMAVYQPFGNELALDIPAGKTGAVLPGGDFFEGTVKACDSQVAKLVNPVFGPRTFRASDNGAVAVVLQLFKPQSAGFEVITKDGSRFPALDVISRDATGVVLRHPRYDGLRIPTADLVEIRAHPSRYTALAEAKPARVVGGNNAISATETGHGVAMPAGTTATWQMQTAGGTFVARVSPGADTPGAEKLIFTVFSDAKMVFRSNPLASGTPPQPVRVVLPAGATLSLRVEGVEGSGVWSEPVVLRR